MQPTSNVTKSKKGSKGKEKVVQELKNTAQMGTAIGASVYGYNKINKSMYGNSYAWNTKINKTLRNHVKGMTEYIKTQTKMPWVTDALGATQNGRIMFNKNSAAWKNLSPLKKVMANAGGKIINFSMDIAEKLSKTSARQKALGLFVATAATGLLLLARNQGKKQEQINQKYNDQTNA